MVRTLRPGATAATLILGDQRLPMDKVHDGGVYAVVVPGHVGDYRVEVSYGDDTWTVDDPYRWLPTLGEVDLHLIGEGRHERLWDALGSHVREYDTVSGTVTGTSFAVWAPNARGVRVTGDFSWWDGRGAADAVARLQRRLGAVRAGHRCRRQVQVPDPRSGRSVAREGRPDGVRRRDPAGHRVGRLHLRLHLERRRVGAQARGHRAARRTDERLRGAPRFLARRPVLPAARRRAGRLPGRERLHARRAAARGRAPVRRLLGLPGHVVLRPDRAVRLPRRVPPPGRPAARRRDRRAGRLGAGALPEGRVGAGPVRRHAAVRAPGSAPRRAARLGHAGLRLRPAGGPQLPGGQRAVLAGGVPRRRPARGRGRLDALPGLLAQRGRVGAEHPRRPGEPGRGGLPPGTQRHRLQATPRHRDDRRGVDLLAGRHPPDPPRRARLRLQVEHGLDARHPRVRRRRRRSTGSSTTTR